LSSLEICRWRISSCVLNRRDDDGEAANSFHCQETQTPRGLLGSSKTGAGLQLT
jgi:hypothetical protein